MKSQVGISELKAIRNRFDLLDREKEKGEINTDYGVSYGDKEEYFSAKEAALESEVKTIASILGVDYDLVIDMVYDIELAQEYFLHGL